MNINELSIEQLKALKCDHYENIEASRQSLVIINKELEERMKATPLPELAGTPPKQPRAKK